MASGMLGIFVSSLLLLASVVAERLTARVGAPLLLVFLGLGMLVGEDGPGGVAFNDAGLAFVIGNAALSLILFDGGLRTPRASVAAAWAPALVLATLGVVVTAAVTAVFARWLFGLEWLSALLIGAILAPTDAAAVFMLLGRSGIALRDRLRATLEVESGSNDPMGVFLTISLLALMHGGTGGDLEAGGAMLVHFATQMGLGAVFGVAGGVGLVWLMNRLELAAGLYPILALAGALCIFASTQLVDGSGYLAVYLAGMIFGNRRVRAGKLVGRFFDGLSWLCQIVMFLMLGLLVTPSALLADLLPALAIAAVTMVAARPLAVAVSLTPFGFSWREQGFAAWVGLRGAVPIFLALFPLLEGIDTSGTYFNVAFVVVLVSLLLQGWTIPWVARLLRVALPPVPEPAPRLDGDLLRPAAIDRDLAGYTVQPRSRAAVTALDKLRLPRRSRILAVLRDGTAMRLSALDRLQAGDFVLLLAPPEQALPLDRLFSAPFSTTVPLFGPDLGDFMIEGSTPMADLAAAYDLPIDPAERKRTLAELLTARLGSHVGRGDRLRLGSLELIVVEKVGADILRVGIRFEPDAPPGRVRLWLRRMLRRPRRPTRP